jgi:hypothetical protein
MKKFVTAIMILTMSFAVIAQDSTSGQKKITQKGQEAHLDYFIKIPGLPGESPDSLPPAPGHLTLSAGGTLSQTRNSNMIERYKVQSKPGFTFNIGYAFEFPKSRLQIGAGYQKGGVTVATGDINGDGKDNATDVDLDYLTMPVQYQFYLGRSKRFFMGAGGYASFLISSKQTGTAMYEEGFKKFDAGITTSAGMWVGSRIMLQTGYNIGFVDIDLSQSKSARNGMAFLVLSYSLTSKLKYGPIIKIKPKGGHH